MFASPCEDLPQSHGSFDCASLAFPPRSAANELAFVNVRGSGACSLGRVGVSPAVRGVPASDTSRVENWPSRRNASLRARSSAGREDGGRDAHPTDGTLDRWRRLATTASTSQSSPNDQSQPPGLVPQDYRKARGCRAFTIRSRRRALAMRASQAEAWQRDLYFAAWT